MSAESLQKVFKTLADPTRLRILKVLEREELAVQELMDVLGMPQSRVSRHLGILREAGWVKDRRDGTFVLYRLALPEDPEVAEAFELASRAASGDAGFERDRLALLRVIDARAEPSRTFFDDVGPEWDAMRKVWSDDLLRARSATHLVPPGSRVIDVGTGTGVLAMELAELGCEVIGIDRSPAMLEAAAEKLAERDVTRVELRQGDAGDLPVHDASQDGAFAHMVLQYLPSPAEAIAEMGRVVRPGGVVVVADFARHEREWMREELGVLWLGFDPSEVEDWLREAGLEDVSHQLQEPSGRGADLPSTFCASGRRPRSEEPK